MDTNQQPADDPKSKGTCVVVSPNYETGCKHELKEIRVMPVGEKQLGAQYAVQCLICGRRLRDDRGQVCIAKMDAIAMSKGSPPPLWDFELEEIYQRKKALYFAQKADEERIKKTNRELSIQKAQAQIENQILQAKLDDRNAIFQKEFERRQTAALQRKAFWEQRNEQRRKEDQDWHDNYAAYRDTPQWKRIVHLIHTRSCGICEGCGEKSAEVVHHLTYAHVGNEFLNELVAYCHDCHDRIHEKGQYKQAM